MTLFCPDGYVPVQEAIAKAALHWFSEQIATLETATADGSAIKSNPNTDVNAMTRLDALTRALGKPSISEGLLQQFEHILTQTEHRLRNFLHQGVLTAYYFGGLFHLGRNAVAHGFWATTEADGVLMSGTYWPFGKARARHEQRPNFPLFFLESELAASLSDEPKPPLPNPDVANVLCGGERKDHDEPARAAPELKSGLGAKTRGIAEAINQLWPSGIPKGLSAKDRNNAVIEWLGASGHSLPTNPERAIQRVLKAQKSQ